MFRLGHDYTYFKKYGICDYRGGGSSGRETCMSCRFVQLQHKFFKPFFWHPKFHKSLRTQLK